MNSQIGGEIPRIRVEIDSDEQQVLKTEKITAVNSEKAGATIEEQIGPTTAASEIEEEITSRFSLAKGGELALNAVTILANVAVAVGLGIRIAKEWDSESASIKVLDIIPLSTTVAQVSLGIVEIGFSLAGVESMILPGLGAVVALIGTILMFVEYLCPANPLRTRSTNISIKTLRRVVKDISSPPQPELDYSMPEKLTVSHTSATLDITISNPQKKKVKISNFILSLPVGNNKSDLFQKPIVGEDQSIENGIACAGLLQVSS
ncbi:hypothetical protein BDW59DRAFT_164162 [Aspergillus cavernicola]|uniref:Uncharacterized protein n=1 Tax=Aspergillus cavernicola TaxID=176166 RepID=A0ABR4I357_9EURO